MTTSTAAKFVANYKKDNDLQGKFTVLDINPILEQYAYNFAKSYSGSFDFMVSVSQQANSGKSLSEKQICAVLNCAAQEGISLLAKEAKNEKKKNEQAVAEFDLSTLEQDLKEVSELNNSSSDSELDAITEKIKAVEAQVNAILKSDPVEKYNKLITESEDSERELFEEFEKQISAFRKNRRKYEMEKSKAEKEIFDLKQQLENLSKEMQLTLQAKAAEAKLDELKKSLEKFKTETLWGQNVMPFQWDDIVFTINAYKAGKSGVLNANDMGLGKTFEAVAVDDILTELFFEEFGRLPRVIWLTKKSLVPSTCREIIKWNPNRIPVPVVGNSKQREFTVNFALENNAMVVVNYDAMNTTKVIRNTEWDIVFMDEVHKLKGGANPKPTQVWENAKDLCKKAKFLFPLSGSPIQNHPKEMWAYLHIFNPDKFPNVRRFQREYCYGYGEYDEQGNPLFKVDWDRMIRILKGQVIRRSKAEVLTDLPDKVREFRYLEMEGEQATIYNQMRDSFFVWLDNQKEKQLTATSILAQLTRLRQIAIMPGALNFKDETTGEAFNLDCNESIKIDEAMEITEELLGADEQVVIFSSQFNGPLFEIESRLKEMNVPVETLTGDNSSQSSELERRFQSGETRVLCINAKTGGEGLNLQVASHAIFLDLWYNPKFNEQAEDRLHRKGQKNAVTIHVLQCENSVDQFITGLLEEKEEMINGIMERKELRKGSDWKDYLSDLL